MFTYYYLILQSIFKNGQVPFYITDLLVPFWICPWLNHLVAQYRYKNYLCYNNRLWLTPLFIHCESFVFLLNYVDCVQYTEEGPILITIVIKTYLLLLCLLRFCSDLLDFPLSSSLELSESLKQIFIRLSVDCWTKKFQ